MKTKLFKTIPFLILISFFIYSCNKLTSPINLPSSNYSNTGITDDDCIITFCTGNPGDLIHIFLGESCNSSTTWVVDLTMDENGCASYNFTSNMNWTHIVQMDRNDCPLGINECSYLFL